MKTYLPNETKAERKERKTREKSGLSITRPITNDDKKYIVCLKWGNKYSSDYVNKLYNMVSKYCTLDYEFVCFTENSLGINKDIRVEPLPALPVKGWWYKPYFMSANLPIKGTLLYLDLDLIVFENIDKFFTYKRENDFIIIRDFNRINRQNWDRINSSVFRLKTGSKAEKYDEFVRNPSASMNRLQGDQDWMYKNCKPWDYWPDEWVESYKWEMRGRETLGLINGVRNFVHPGEPKIKKDTSIAVFHGKPDIHEIKDQWVVDNWQ